MSSSSFWRSRISTRKVGWRSTAFDSEPAVGRSSAVRILSSDTGRSGGPCVSGAGDAAGADEDDSACWAPAGAAIKNAITSRAVNRMEDLTSTMTVRLSDVNDPDGAQGVPVPEIPDLVVYI